MRLHVFAVQLGAHETEIKFQPTTTRWCGIITKRCDKFERSISCFAISWPYHCAASGTFRYTVASSERRNKNEGAINIAIPDVSFGAWTAIFSFALCWATRRFYCAITNRANIYWFGGSWFIHLFWFLAFGPIPVSKMGTVFFMGVILLSHLMLLRGKAIIGCVEAKAGAALDFFHI